MDDKTSPDFTIVMKLDHPVFGCADSEALRVALKMSLRSYMSQALLSSGQLIAFDTRKPRVEIRLSEPYRLVFTNSGFYAEFFRTEDETSFQTFSSIVVKLCHGLAGTNHFTLKQLFYTDEMLDEINALLRDLIEGRHATVLERLTSVDAVRSPSANFFKASITAKLIFDSNARARKREGKKTFVPELSCNVKESDCDTVTVSPLFKLDLDTITDASSALTNLPPSDGSGSVEAESEEFSVPPSRRLSRRLLLTGWSTQPKRTSPRDVSVNKSDNALVRLYRKIRRGGAKKSDQITPQGERRRSSAQFAAVDSISSSRPKLSESPGTSPRSKPIAIPNGSAKAAMGDKRDYIANSLAAVGDTQMLRLFQSSVDSGELTSLLGMRTHILKTALVKWGEAQPNCHKRAIEHGVQLTMEAGHRIRLQKGVLQVDSLSSECIDDLVYLIRHLPTVEDVEIRMSNFDEDVLSRIEEKLGGAKSSGQTYRL